MVVAIVVVVVVVVFSFGGGREEGWVVGGWVGGDCHQLHGDQSSSIGDIYRERETVYWITYRGGLQVERATGQSIYL